MSHDLTRWRLVDDLWQSRGLVSLPADSLGWAGLDYEVGVADSILTEYTDATQFTTGSHTFENKHFIDTAISVSGSAVVTLKHCLIDGYVDCFSGGVVSLEDCTVEAGEWVGAAVGSANVTAYRCDIKGGQHSIKCDAGADIRYCYLHDQWNDPNAIDGFHNNAFISNGGSHGRVYRNTLECATELTPNGGGPTGDLSLFGDFGLIGDWVVDRNLFRVTTGSYGLSAGYNPSKPYGANPTGIIVTNNVFELGDNNKCGAFGNVTSFLASANNTWLNNKDDLGNLIGSSS